MTEKCLHKLKLVSYIGIILIFIIGRSGVSKGQQVVSEVAKKYETTAPKSERRAQAAGPYAQALFFNQQTDKAIAILRENLQHATHFQDSQYAAYLSAILAMNYRILDDITSSNEYSARAEKYARQSKSMEIKGYVAYCQGWLHIRSGNENEAVRYFLAGLNHFEKAPPSATLLARTTSILTELASVYANWKEYGLQEKYSKQALEIAIKQNDASTIFRTYMLMGHMYEQQYINTDKSLPVRNLAERYYLKAINFYLSHEGEIPFQSDLSYAAINLANLYMRYYNDEQKQKAIQYAYLAIENAQKLEHFTQIASAYGIIAEIELKENKLSDAKAHLLKSLSEIVKDPLADEQILMNINLSLSEIYEREGHLEDAIHYYKEYIRLFSAVYDTEKMEQGRRLEAQFEVERKEQRMLRMQLEADKKEQQINLMHILGLQREQELQNSKLNEDNQRKELELVNLEADKQSQELRLSRMESQQRAQDILTVQNELSYKDKISRNYGILAASLFLLLLVLGYAFQQRSKTMRQKEELHHITLEKERQHSKISTLTAMLEGQEQERGRLARDLHDGLGGLLSGTKINLSQVLGRIQSPERIEVEQSLAQLDSAVNELRRVAHNLMPDLLKKYGLEESLSDYATRMTNPDLEVSTQFLHYTERLNEEQQLIIYRIIQELVNNAVKHAEANHILIQVVEEEHKLSVTVEDNGRGFDVHLAQAKKSAGLLNVQSRISFLKGNLDIQSSPSLGTTVEIDFPIG